MKRNETKATVKNIDFNSDRQEIIITISAKNSMYVEPPHHKIPGGGVMGFPSLINSGPLLEGLNIILLQGHEAVKLLKGDKPYNDLQGKISHLESIIQKMVQFEKGEQVKMKGMTYQKGINEFSFYEAL